MNPEYKADRWSEVLDGQRAWERNKCCDGDDDQFRTEYIDPMQELEAEGRFELDMVTHNARGRTSVIAIRIRSAINYD